MKTLYNNRVKDIGDQSRALHQAQGFWCYSQWGIHPPPAYNTCSIQISRWHCKFLDLQIWRIDSEQQEYIPGIVRMNRGYIAEVLR